MTYISLYRKYRPKNFAELSGQEHIKQTLLSELLSSKISHAYLFAGPRGTGKTSMARILARAVNCDSPKEGEPCNACPRCLEFAEGTALDLLEIDAASNRGIDEIRELRERISFAPAIAKYKIFIIDEVHMLTKEAFNALLKTLEEPPAHAIFILATTEAHKIPATILSRCQHFSFHNLPLAAIADRLKKVISEEKIEMDEDALLLVAQKSRGALRDALSMLDQLRILDKQIEARDVMELLGSLDASASISVLQKVAEKDNQVLTLLAQLFEEGADPGAFLDDLAEHLRRLIFIKSGNQFILKELTKEQQADILALKDKFSFEELTRFLSGVLAAAQQLKTSPLAELPIELLVVEMLGIVPEVVVQPAEIKKTENSTQAVEVKPRPIASVSSPAVSAPPVSVGQNDLLALARGCWGEILVKLKGNPTLQAVVRSAQLISAQQDILTMEFPYRFHFDRASESRNKILLEKLFSESLARRIALEFKLAEKDKGDSLEGMVSEVFDLNGEEQNNA